MKKQLTILLLFVFSIAAHSQIVNTTNDLPQKLTKALLEEKDQRMYMSLQLETPLYYKSFVAVYQLDSMKYDDYDNDNSTWYPDDMEHLLYNADKQCIAEIDFDYDTAFTPEISDIYWYSYDADGYLAQEMAAYWYNGQWDTNWKEVYTYNSANQFTSMIEYDYDKGQWEENWKSEYTYDNNGYLIKREYFDWDNGMWDPYSKDDYVNYSDGRVKSEIGQYKSSSTFQLDDSTYYTYNTSLQLIERRRYDWDNSNAIWEEDYLYDYTYYATGELETRTNYYYYNSSWDTSYRYHYIYNPQGFLTERVELDWNKGLWQNDYKNVYTYDMNYSVPLITANPNYLDDLSDMMLMEAEYRWDDDNAVWEDYDRNTLYWSHTGLAVEEHSTNDVKIYPIPTSNKINIELSTYEPTIVRLVDLKGQLLQEKQMNSTRETLHIEGYSSGLYLLIIEKNGSKSVQKVMIQ